MTNDETISSKRYCLILKLKYCDSTVSKATLDKKSASISLINSCYAAYDPPITPHYQLIDSLISFSIISTNNFSNEMKQGDTINNLFNVFYSEANDSKNDSIGYLTMLSQKHLYLTINSTLKQKEGHYTYPYLNIVFTPKIEIRSDNLQIKIIAKFNSGRIVIDSTKAIKIN